MMLLVQKASHMAVYPFANLCNIWTHVNDHSKRKASFSLLLAVWRLSFVLLYHALNDSDE
jgi:hypothetical protein